MPAIYNAIAQPPQQHLNSIHFAMAILLLLLTVYPYLFNSSQVAALSSDDLDLTHQSIETFDIIRADDIVWSRSLKIRDTTNEQLLHVASPILSSSSSSSQPTNAPTTSTTTAPSPIKSDFQNELSNAITPSKQKQEKSNTRKVKFSSLGRIFNLILDRRNNNDNYLTTEGFTVVTLDGEGKETLVPFNRNNIQILDGYVDGEKTGSRVTASFSPQDKLMTAQIKTGNETIIVEPTYLHKKQLLLSSGDINNTARALGLANLNASIPSDQATSVSLPDELYNGTMIVYKLRDHKQFQETNNNNTFDLRNLCAAIKVESDSQLALNKTIEDRRAPDAGFQELIMDKQSNENSFEQQDSDKNDISSSEMGQKLSRISRRSIEGGDKSRDKKRCTLHLVADYLFYKNVGNGDIQTTINYLLALVNRVNLIYLPTVWETGDENDGGFKNIGFSVQNITIHQEYTRASANSDIHYNMASDRLWGAREYLDNFSKNSPPRHYCLAHLFTYRQFDTPVLGLAYVASPRLGAIGGICSQVQQKGDLLYKHNTGISTSKGISGETLITRQTDLVVAHELGHNLGAEHDSNECRPAPSKGGAFLMHPFAVMGFEKNNRFLSNCSRFSIGKVLKRKASTCFIQVVDHVCGNGIIEDDEECDGGDLGYGHRDPCCDSSCRFTPGSQCSDRHSWCCNKCRIQIAGFPCRPAEELNCKQSSYCDGRSADCPPAPPIEDNKTCIGGGFCRSGDCIPFCEAHNKLSCMCNTPAHACKLCCKSTMNSTCSPYDQSAPYLPDGNQCYRGVCEKGRCEQPIQDVVERLWDVIEDITFTTFVKFLRDNIILVVLVCSIPIWCLFSYYINEFDRRFKQQLMNAMMRQRERRKRPASQSPFLPRLFVSDDLNDSNDSLSKNDPMARQPLRPQPNNPSTTTTGLEDVRGSDRDPRNGAGYSMPQPPPPPHQPGFIHGRLAANYGFNLPEGEEVVFGPGNIAMNSIEFPHNRGAMDELSSNNATSNNTSNNDMDDINQDDMDDQRIGNSYSTQV